MADESPTYTIAQVEEALQQARILRVGAVADGLALDIEEADRLIAMHKAHLASLRAAEPGA